MLRCFLCARLIAFLAVTIAALEAMVGCLSDRPLPWVSLRIDRGDVSARADERGRQLTGCLVVGLARLKPVVGDTLKAVVAYPLGRPLPYVVGRCVRIVPGLSLFVATTLSMS